MSYSLEADMVTWGIKGKLSGAGGVSCSFKWGGLIGFSKKVTFAERLRREGVSQAHI